MTSKEFQPASIYAVAGTLVTALIAVLWSARAAALITSFGLLVLAWLRYTMKNPRAITARSTQFDTLFLSVLGIGMLVLAITADNI